MFKWFIGIFDRLCAVMGAFAFSQIPLFYQQYTQRLAGHLAEAKLQVGLLEHTAQGTGKTLQAYIGKFLSQNDSDFVAQGQLMDGMVTRLSSLQESYEALATATPWWRPYFFAKYSHADIAEAALRDFSPGIAMTLETALYAIIGMVFGYLFFRILRALFSGAMRLGNLASKPRFIHD